MRLGALVCSLALVAPLTGCPDREIASVVPALEGSEAKTILGTNRELDLLFVIDNSGSMKEEQESLVKNFTNFINVLRVLPGGLPDLHIGVVTSDVGQNNAGKNIPGCDGFGEAGNMRTGGVLFSNGARYLSDVRDPNNSAQRIKNYAQDTTVNGDLAAAFAKMATVGTTGCGFEQHLASMEKALVNNSMNAGFLRKDALLAVIIIADEDDCSAKNDSFFGNASGLGDLDNFRCTAEGVVCGPDDNGSIRRPGMYTDCRPRENSPHMRSIADVTTAIRKLKPFPDEQIIVAAIIGPENPFGIRAKDSAGHLEVAPACTYQKPNCTVTGTETCKQNAAPSVRLNAFVDNVVKHYQTTICKDDLSDSIQAVAEYVAKDLNPRCFKSPLADPPVCNVTDILNYETANEAADTVPECNDAKSNLPCWHVETNLTDCVPDLFSGKQMVIERSDALPATAVTKVECEGVPR
jgi:hypothetical protein